MTYSAEGWFLYAGEAGRTGPGPLVRETFEISALGPEEVLAEPLFGSWEGNMGHAVERKPIDICVARKEPKVILGNSGVVRIKEVGRDVKTVRPGQKAIIFCNGEEDWWGYPKKILGYDAPNTMGCLATKMKLTQRQVIPLPENTRHPLAQWAAFSLRYITAWSNWELAYGTFRLLISRDELASINVWGWGGGTTLAELDLARREGHKAVMLSSTPRHLEVIRQLGVTEIDRSKFGELGFDEAKYADDAGYRGRYQAAEKQFLAEVDERTTGRGVQIFIDFVGAPVFRVSLKALAREGVIATAGWKDGMKTSSLRAIECIARHQHIHTHYARYPQGWAAVAFANASGWLPPVDERVYTFDQVPELAERYAAGEVGLFPVFSINEQ